MMRVPLTAAFRIGARGVERVGTGARRLCVVLALACVGVPVSVAPVFRLLLSLFLCDFSLFPRFFCIGRCAFEVSDGPRGRPLRFMRTDSNRQSTLGTLALEGYGPNGVASSHKDHVGDYR